MANEENGLANVLQESSDYDKFKFILNNRDANRGHIEALKLAFEEMGNLTKVQPILVNSKFEIIDGQHRFVAAKELGTPIFYTVVPGLGINEARSMNILHRSWTSDDFAHSYADGGDPNYQRYLKLREDYGFSHSVTLMYVSGADVRGSFAGFRRGELVIDEEAYAKAQDRLTKLSEVGELVPMSQAREFAYAMLRIMDMPQYDHKRMLNKLKLNGDMMKRYGTVGDYQRALEDIYNHKVTEAHRVRLF